MTNADVKEVLPGDVLTEIKRQFDWRGPNGKPQGHIVITREQAEALLRAPELINKAIDNGIEEFLEAVANAGEIREFFDAVKRARKGNGTDQ
jgi:hypothetical protein